MLSARARNVLTAAGFDLTDLAGTVLKVRASLATGIRWRNCGKKTLSELDAWVGAPTVQANQINEELVVRGAVAVLESRGYTVSHSLRVTDWNTAMPQHALTSAGRPDSI